MIVGEGSVGVHQASGVIGDRTAGIWIALSGRGSFRVAFPWALPTAKMGMHFQCVNFAATPAFAD